MKFERWKKPLLKAHHRHEGKSAEKDQAQRRPWRDERREQRSVGSAPDSERDEHTDRLWCPYTSRPLFNMRDERAIEALRRELGRRSDPQLDTRQRIIT